MKPTATPLYVAVVASSALNAATKLSTCQREMHAMSFQPRVLRLSELLPGDILYFRPLIPSTIERRIAKKSGSPYTHVAIYLGKGQILHAIEPRVAVGELSSWLSSDLIGVARSQMGFGPARVKKLNDFADRLITKGAAYSVDRKTSFFDAREVFIENPFGYLLKHHDEAPWTREDFELQSFVCSGLVVAALAVVGIIDDSAQVAYPYQYIAPADLHRDPTFGWFIGYLVPNGEIVPQDDPLLRETWYNFQQNA